MEADLLPSVLRYHVWMPHVRFISWAFCCIKRKLIKDVILPDIKFVLLVYNIININLCWCKLGWDWSTKHIIVYTDLPLKLCWYWFNASIMYGLKCTSLVSFVSINYHILFISVQSNLPQIINTKKPLDLFHIL